MRSQHVVLGHKFDLLSVKRDARYSYIIEMTCELMRIHLLVLLSAAWNLERDNCPLFRPVYWTQYYITSLQYTRCIFTDYTLLASGWDSDRTTNAMIRWNMAARPICSHLDWERYYRPHDTINWQLLLTWPPFFPLSAEFQWFKVFSRKQAIFLRHSCLRTEFVCNWARLCIWLF